MKKIQNWNCCLDCLNNYTELYLTQVIFRMQNSFIKVMMIDYWIFTNSLWSGPTTCPAASIVLSLSPIANVHRYVSVLVSNEDEGSTSGSNAEKDNRLRMALSTLCHWLCYWEGTPLLHKYIISFMKALQVSSDNRCCRNCDASVSHIFVSRNSTNSKYCWTFRWELSASCSMPCNFLPFESRWSTFSCTFWLRRVIPSTLSIRSVHLYCCVHFDLL